MRAKLTDLHWHDLRHTFASWAVQQGATLQEVKELLGHGSLAMVMLYAHLSPVHLRHAVARWYRSGLCFNARVYRTGGGVSEVLVVVGAPGRSRTCDPRIRSPMLYPTELQARAYKLIRYAFRGASF